MLRSTWLSLLPIFAISGFDHPATARTYEETISALRPFVDIPRSGVREMRAQMDEQVAEIVKQWDGYSDLRTLEPLLRDLSGDKYRLQAQKWMFRIHAGDLGFKGDLLARLAQSEPNEDQRHRLLLLADPRYTHPSSQLRSVLVEYLDDRTEVWDEESRLRWSMRGRLQCVLFEYLSKHQLIPENDDLPQLSAYLDPEFEDPVIVRTKRLIAAHPEHFAAPDTEKRSGRDENVSPDAAARSQLTAPTNASKTTLESAPATTNSEESASSAPWSVIVVLIVAATGLLWLLVKKRK